MLLLQVFVEILHPCRVRFRLRFGFTVRLRFGFTVSLRVRVRLWITLNLTSCLLWQV